MVDQLYWMGREISTQQELISLVNEWANKGYNAGTDSVVEVDDKVIQLTFTVEKLVDRITELEAQVRRMS